MTGEEVTYRSVVGVLVVEVASIFVITSATIIRVTTSTTTNNLLHFYKSKTKHKYVL